MSNVVVPTHATPVIMKLHGQWAVVLGSVTLFKSLDKNNCLDYIKYSWNGEQHGF
jgi:hypothetical protein